MDKKEYIERGAFLRKCAEAWGHYGVTIKAIEGIADECAAADVVEVVHGRWIFEHDPIKDPKKYFVRIVCSCCGLKTGQVSNFCPKCGAKMDGERKEQSDV